MKAPYGLHKGGHQLAMYFIKVIFKNMDYHSAIPKIVLKAVQEIEALADSDLSLRPSPTKWSKKEIVGHLIDSAYNNHQRIVRAERQGNLYFQGYDQEDWVIKNNYQHRAIGELLPLWQMTNGHLVILIENVGEHLLNREFSQHNFHQICMNPLPVSKTASLSYLIWDYVFHMEHHLIQILPGYEKINSAFKSPIEHCRANMITTDVPWLAFR